VRKTNRFLPLFVVVVALMGAQPAQAGRLSGHLGRVADTVTSRASVQALNRTGFVSLSTRAVAGHEQVFVSVILEARPTVLPFLHGLGAEVNSVLSQGYVTANVPVSALRSLEGRDDVGRIEPGQRVHMMNDLSNALIETSPGVWAGMNNPSTHDGTGVIVGVVDSGLDWTHGDFVDDATGQSRILYYWDQSDVDDDRLPSGTGWSFTYGHEYTKADFDGALAVCADWDPLTNTFGAVDDPACPIKVSAGDFDGHGTHVTGTAAGDGSASGYVGVAPGADIVFVKFDFEGDRNTSASIVDAVNYIFKRAAALGRPAVVNMSLGSDYGPHDGSTLEERSLDALIGAGKVVVVAAGNPGANNWSGPLAWGYSLHGNGVMGTDPVTFRFPTYTPDTTGEGSYVFFDLWYGGSETCRVRVTTPSGKVYPPSFSGSYKNTWKTGQPYYGFNTTEGAIFVGNGGDQLGWSTNDGDHELYVEISDYYGVDPKKGTWKIEIVPLTVPEGGRYDAWYGVSSDVVRGWRAEATPRQATPLFGGRQSDNAVTIGSPASASRIIAAAAYTTRASWTYYDPTTDQASTTPQSYAAAPIGYYDPFAVGELAYFSARGPRRDGVLKPEIATPGVGIASAFSHYTRQVEWPDRAVPYASGGPYHFATNRVLPNLEGAILQGTSMACPNATGAVALILQAAPYLDDNGLRTVFDASARHDTATDTWQYVAQTAATDTDAGAGAGLPNDDWGYGKMDLAASIAFAPTIPNTDTVAITSVAWNTKKKQLTVKATSTQAPTAALSLQYSTNGGATWLPATPLAMTYASGTYSKTVTLTTKPGLVRVTSSKGGSAQKAVP
jgi:subtilisin family serine protease